MFQGITIFQVVGLLMLIGLMAIMSYVYLNRKTYASETGESRKILRLFGTLFGGIAASGIIDGTIRVEGTELGLAINASGGLAFALVIWFGWEKYDDELDSETAKKLIADGIEEKLGGEIATSILNGEEPNQFGEQIHASDLKKAMHSLAEDAKAGNRQANQTLIKLSHQKNYKLLLEYFQKKKSRLNSNLTNSDNVILANLLFIDGSYDSSKKLIEEALISDTSDIDSRMLLAMILEREGKQAEAIETLQDGIDYIPAPKNTKEFNTRGSYFSFLAHLTEPNELSEYFWSEAYDSYNRANNVVGKAESLFAQKNRKEHAKKLVNDLPNVPIKTKLLRDIAFNLLHSETNRNENLELAFAKLASALETDKLLKDDQAIAADYTAIAEYHSIKKDLKLAREASDKALEASLNSMCWKAFRSALLSRGEIEAESGNIVEMRKWMEEARLLCEKADDEKSAKIIEDYANNLGFRKTGESFGFMNPDESLNEEYIEFGIKLTENEMLDELDYRMSAFELRKQLLSFFEDKETIVGLGYNEGRELFYEFGFDTEDDLEVNLDAVKHYIEKMQSGAKNLDTSSWLQLLKLRQEQMIILEKAYEEKNRPNLSKIERITRQRTIYLTLGMLHRMGFDPLDYSKLDYGKSKKVQEYLTIGSVDGEVEQDFDESPFFIAIQVWATAFAILEDEEKTEKEIDIAIKMLEMTDVIDSKFIEELNNDDENSPDLSVSSVEKITMKTAKRIHKIAKSMNLNQAI